MGWNNVDLSSHERQSNILAPYSFDTLLLEVSCNLKVINEETVRKQFVDSMQSKIGCAYQVFNSNIENIVKQAKAERNTK